MKFKDKEGNKLTFKEFMDRWKKGIEGITPLQKLKTQINGTKIMLIGLLAGLVVSIIGFKKLWWVGIILIGALFNTVVQYLSLMQQRRLLQNLEDQFNLPAFEEEKEEDTLGEMKQADLTAKVALALLSKESRKGKGCGEYVEEEYENGAIGFLCGDTHKGVTPLCKECKKEELKEEEKGGEKKRWIEEYLLV